MVTVEGCVPSDGAMAELTPADRVHRRRRVKDLGVDTFEQRLREQLVQADAVVGYRTVFGSRGDAVAERRPSCVPAEVIGPPR
jgi:hypothetical protein